HIAKFEAAERTIVGVHNLGPEQLVDVSAHHLSVIVASGPFGTEIVVQPVDAGDAQPAEYHVWLPGAVRSAAEYRVGRLSGSWGCPGDTEVELWLRSEDFGVNDLPVSVTQGYRSTKLDTVVQLHPTGPKQSALIITLGGEPPASELDTALVVVKEIAAATASSTASRALAPVSGVRFAEIAAAAAAGLLGAPATPFRPPPPPPPPPPSSATPAAAATSQQPPPPSASDRIASPRNTVQGRAAAIRAALTPYVGKRVHLGPIADPQVAASVMARIAPDVNPGDVVGYLDAGIRASGKVGYVLTAEALHIGVTGDERTVAYDDIRSVHFDAGKLHLETGSNGMTQPDAHEIGAQLTAAIHDVLSLR
ncbi:MAG: hypothetical protein ACJAR2_004282, partial [Ilumatobacter sp.]